MRQDSSKVFNREAVAPIGTKYSSKMAAQQYGGYSYGAVGFFWLGSAAPETIVDHIGHLWRRLDFVIASILALTGHDELNELWEMSKENLACPVLIVAVR